MSGHDCHRENINRRNDPQEDADLTKVPLPEEVGRMLQQYQTRVHELEKQCEQLRLQLAEQNTDRTHRAEEALQEKATQLSNLADNLPNAMVYQITATPDGGRRFTYVSRGAERLNGVTAEDFLADASLIYKQMLPEYQAQIRDLEEQALKQLAPLHAEALCRLPDGRLRWFEFTSTPRHLPDGLLVWDGVEVDVTERKLAEEELERRVEERTQSLSREIEERKKAQQALRYSERLLVEAQHLSHVGSWRWDTASGKAHWSDEFYLIAGRVPGEPATGLLDEPGLFAGESRQRLQDALDNVAQTGQPYEVGLELLRPDREIRHVICRGRAENDETGAATVFYGTLQDVTEWKRALDERRSLEARVQYAQKFESLGILAGGVAHDFNNILQIILGNANHLQKIVSDVSPTRPFIDNIEKSVNRAASLTRQMLVYAGKGQASLKILDVSETTDDIVHLIHSSVPKKITIQADLRKGLPPVLADATQVQQVAMNLLLNAVEALEPEQGGTIVVSTSALYCTEDYLQQSRTLEKMKEGEYVCLEVSDKGCGMNEAILSQVFDPFFTTKFTGRGLGMSAVIGIMRAHNGAMLLESAPGLGTTVRALFPAITRPVPTDAGEPEHPADAPQTGGIILFVDDELDMVDLGVLVLEQMGYTVLTATDGATALDIFRQHAPDIRCVLLDVNMPHMDGGQILLELRRIRPDVRVILTSGYTKKELEAQFADMNVNAFIEKPYSVRDLSVTLTKVLS